MLQDVARGDEHAFARLFHAYRDKLYGFIVKITGSRELAEDVVQDVFLKIWTHRSNLHEVENFNAYLFRMSHNQVMNGLKRMNLESSIRLRLARLVQAASEDPESVLMYKHTRELLKEAGSNFKVGFSCDLHPSFPTSKSRWKANGARCVEPDL